MFVDQIMELDSHKLLVGAGIPADSSNFMEFIQKNMKLYELNNDLQLTTHAAANFIRGEVTNNNYFLYFMGRFVYDKHFQYQQLAKALRKGPYQTNLLLAGYAEKSGPELYFMDMYAALAKVNFGAHGYAANFVLSVLDRDWTKNMNMEQGIEVIKKCIHELKTRFMISQPVFSIKIVDQSGI